MDYFRDSDYRTLLQREWDVRKAKNPKYSLRSFARLLRVSPTTLSLVLRGRRGLSEESIERIADALAMDPKEKRKFRAMVFAVDARSENLRKKYETELKALNTLKLPEKGFNLAVDQFRVIADWHYLALLEHLSLADYQRLSAEQSLRWLSKKLGLSLGEVHSALDRLKNLNLVSTQEGKSVRTEGVVRTGDQTPSSAIKSHHKQYLEKAIYALESQSFENTDFSGSLMAVDSKRFADAKKLIRQFRKKMLALMCQSENSNSVYRLSVNFFKVTHD